MIHSNWIVSIMTIVSHLFFISIAFWWIQDIHIERYIRMHESQAKVMIVMLSVVFGFICSSFFIDVVNAILGLTTFTKSL
ncbi:DUF1146 family protein [Lactobacillus sp. Sy-1]|uniref:DUF1146 family protein n=1 Tax=Lactobacillus sp. Sy-1 TaxID=2109645 RepID=UPI001C5B6511|nr:DUF1146 family protein [Lactobacillus sp. Sy-1]MBW1605835.1 DUF1146 domain-containing protein [Lactobacillus sp. Sy-1]